MSKKHNRGEIILSRHEEHHEQKPKEGEEKM
jgi:hypothetical protein